MPRSNEDETWRAIVEHYGDRAELDPDEVPVTEPARTRSRSRRS